jgi:hypothetical protein
MTIPLGGRKPVAKTLIALTPGCALNWKAAPAWSRFVE